MEKSSDTKHILISGGARGLGLAIVQGLVQEGYKVSTFSRRITPELEHVAATHPESVYCAAVDLVDAAAVAEFVKTATGRLGHIYGLINNAAIAQDGVLATLPEVEISRMLNINLESALRLTRLAIRSQLKSGAGGRIINISSIIASRGYTGLAVYAASKAGLEGMTRALARELGPRQITVNAIAPGYMRSDLSAGLTPGQLDQIVRRTPLGRLATFEDVVPMILFLLSPTAAFITGQSVIIDGGITV